MHIYIYCVCVSIDFYIVIDKNEVTLFVKRKWRHENLKKNRYNLSNTIDIVRERLCKCLKNISLKIIFYDCRKLLKIFSSAKLKKVIVRYVPTYYIQYRMFIANETFIHVRANISWLIEVTKKFNKRNLHDSFDWVIKCI